MPADTRIYMVVYTPTQDDCRRPSTNHTHATTTAETRDYDCDAEAGPGQDPPGHDEYMDPNCGLEGASSVCFLYVVRRLGAGGAVGAVVCLFLDCASCTVVGWGM